MVEVRAAERLGGNIMTNLKTMALALVLVAGATSLAMAQNGPPTPPPAGGTAGSMSSGSTMSHHKTMHHTTSHYKKTMSHDNMKSQ